MVWAIYFPFFGKVEVRIAFNSLRVAMSPGTPSRRFVCLTGFGAAEGHAGPLNTLLTETSEVRTGP